MGVERWEERWEERCRRRDGHERGEKGGGSTCSRLDGHESSQHASMTRSHVLSSLNIGTCTLTHAAPHAAPSHSSN